MFRFERFKKGKTLKKHPRKRTMLQKINTAYQKYIRIGADETTSTNTLKRIKLFNVFSLVWYLFIILIVVESLIENNYISKETYISSFLMFFSITVCRYFLRKKQYTVAYSVFVFQIIGLTFYFSNFLNNGEFLEYYYIFAPTICLIFIDNKKIIYTTLILSYLCFVFPNFYFKHYPLSTFTDLSISFLYFAIFTMVNYFKNLNIKNEKALKYKTEELEELNNFKSQFFTNISHEIRTPITLIKGYANALGKPNCDVVETQENINRQIDKITEMVNNVLDLAKMENAQTQLKTSVINVSELIYKLYISFEPLFKQKELDFILNLPAKKYFVNANALFLERSLSNIILNALKYTETGNVTITVEKKQKNLEITIKDTGIGIAKADISKIFNRFYQIDNHINQAGGSGVGLAFSKEVIDLHKGKLTVKSEEGSYTSFKIRLPLNKVEVATNVEGQERKTVEDTVVVSEKIPANYTFLLVDDNYEMLTYLKNILQNYQCLTATNGLEALAVIAKNNVNFIITDYMMPNLNGYDFIKQLQAKNYDIPTIMLTAKADMVAKLEVLRLGIDDYITKPFDKDELIVRIKNAIKNNDSKKEFLEQNPEVLEEKNTINFIEKLKEFIVENIQNENLSQSFIAEKFNTSKSSLYRKIKSHTGMTPSEFITEVRLLQARRITENNPSILLKQLITEVGFHHVSHFSKIYAERFGSKP